MPAFNQWHDAAKALAVLTLTGSTTDFHTTPAAFEGLLYTQVLRAPRVCLAACCQPHGSIACPISRLPWLTWSCVLRSALTSPSSSCFTLDTFLYRSSCS